MNPKRCDEYDYINFLVAAQKNYSCLEANRVQPIQAHRGLKQFCGVEKCQARSATAQRNHIAMALRAFLRLKTYSYTTGDSWFEAKMQIIRDAIKHSLVSPTYNLTSTA